MLNELGDEWLGHYFLEIVIADSQKLGYLIRALCRISTLSWQEVYLALFLNLTIEHLAKTKIFTSKDITHCAAYILNISHLLPSILTIWPNIVLL